MGGEPLSAVGFGFGDAVVMELLTNRNLLPSFNEGREGVLLFVLTEELRESAIDLSCELRRGGVKVDLVLDQRKVKWVFQKADKIGAKYVLLFGHEEQSREEVIVKDMISGEQKSVKRKDVIHYIESNNK